MLSGTNSYSKEALTINNKNTIRIFFDNFTNDFTTEFLNKYYNGLKTNSLVSGIGTFYQQKLQITKDDNMTHKEDITALFLDSNIFENIDSNLIKGEMINFQTINTSNEVPILITENLEGKYPIGTYIETQVPDYKNMRMKNKIFVVKGVISKDIKLWKGNSTTINNSILRNEFVIISPMINEFESGQPLLTRLSMNLFVNLKDTSSYLDFKMYVSGLLSKNNLKGSVWTLEEQIIELQKLSRTIIIFTLSLSALLFTLSVLGMMGIMLASIVRRRYEFGIRYMIGATPTSLIMMLFIEVVILVLISAVIGTCIASLILNQSYKNIPYLIGYSSILYTILISLLIAFVGSLIPIFKFSRQQPINLIRER